MPGRGVVWDNNTKKNLVAGLVVWTNPFWNICTSQIGWFSPGIRGEHTKYLSCHHLVWVWKGNMIIWNYWSMSDCDLIAYDFSACHRSATALSCWSLSFASPSYNFETHFVGTWISGIDSGTPHKWDPFTVSLCMLFPYHSHFRIPKKIWDLYRKLTIFRAPIGGPWNHPWRSGGSLGASRPPNPTSFLQGFWESSQPRRPRGPRWVSRRVFEKTTRKRKTRDNTIFMKITCTGKSQ